MEKTYAIGVDLGGTKIEVALVNSEGKIEKKQRTPTQVNKGPKAVENQIIGAIRDITLELSSPILGVGIGLAGQIEKNTGAVHLAPNLKWTDLPFQQDLIEKLGMNVVVINDVRAATWGEWLFGSGKGCDDLVCVFIGTGIGGGVVSEGRMLTGSTNSLGEIGHMIIDWKGAACTCGNQGCWETIAGGWGIAQRARKAIEKHSKKGEKILADAKNKLENVSAKIVIENYKSGDPLAKELIDETIEAIGAGCVSVVNAFNPAKLILGGGIIDACPEWIPLIEKIIGKKALPIAREKLTIVPSSLGQDAGVIGAAAQLFESVKLRRPTSQ